MQKVVVALPGTTLHPTSGESFEIKAGKIRGEVSEGMICAEDEIGIGKDHNGIIVLNDDAVVGSTAREYYNISDDYSIEIDLTPNRTDAISHFGVARDFLAVHNLRKGKDETLNLPDVSGFEKDNNDLPIEVEVKDSHACPRYTGLSMTGIEVGESPEWLKQRLTTVGLKPINNVVDIANYVMYETGQPLHVFDADEIIGNKVIVQELKKGTPFTTLDGEERKLDGEDLMICNNRGGMCIAGVFGGLTSGVKSSTKRIFIESAYFSGSGIRKTARRHGLNTDASYRYERGANVELTVYALKRVAGLIREICGARISSDIVDVYPEKIKRAVVNLRWDYLRLLSGQPIKKEDVTGILRSLGFDIISNDESELILIVPPYRAEVTREVDVVEEILRIYGYENIDIPARMTSSVSTAEHQDEGEMRNRASSILSDRGFREIVNNSLTSEKYYGEEADQVRLSNPLSSELSVMRMALDHGGLESIRFNLNRKSPDLKFFEFGKTYALNEDSSFRETSMLGLWMTGLNHRKSWRKGEKRSDFFDMKEELEHLLKKMGFVTGRARIKEFTSEMASHGLSFSVKKRKIARLWNYHPDVLSKMDIDQEVIGGEINWDNLLWVLGEKGVKFQALPKFPSIRRDLALLLDEAVQYSEIERIAWDTESRILRSVSLFDIYRGKGIDPHKKSYAVSLLFQDEKKTLTDKQVDRIVANLVKRLGDELGAELR